MKGIKEDPGELNAKRDGSELRIKSIRSNIVKELDGIDNEQVLTILYSYICNLKKM